MRCFERRSKAHTEVAAVAQKQATQPQLTVVEHSDEIVEHLYRCNVKDPGVAYRHSAAFADKVLLRNETGRMNKRSVCCSE